MTQSGPVPTRERIIAAASKLFYSEGVRSVSVDAVAALAGLTKRSLYYHFSSKDELVAAYLDSRDHPNMALFQRWWDEANGDAAQRVLALFQAITRAARHPDWRGCGFLRTAAELANMPGHPAMKVCIAHKKRFETWLRDQLAASGLTSADDLARKILLLWDGAFALVLLHRDPSYMETAGDAAFALTSAALAMEHHAPPRRSAVA